ncbi:MAG: Uma2 family endonuclease [Gemmatimonadetes bacterium]|nr:Uma2 family endonuclease [Gemmatimonadota bacterium]
MSTRPSPPVAPISPEEYLAAEREAEYKSEYFGGEILAMTGASREHNLLVSNLVASLHPQLRGRPCELYPSDMRVKITRTGAYAYPDVVVVCGEPEFEDEHVDTLLNPTVLIEVLSPSTERHDRGRKWEHYRRLPSLTEFLLVAQDKPRIEHYLRQEGGLWLFADASGEDASLRLSSIGCTLALRDVYDRVL